jgi:hypothetical protein
VKTATIRTAVGAAISGLVWLMVTLFKDRI